MRLQKFYTTLPPEALKGLQTLPEIPEIRKKKRTKGIRPELKDFSIPISALRKAGIQFYENLLNFVKYLFHPEFLSGCLRKCFSAEEVMGFYFRIADKIFGSLRDIAKLSEGSIPEGFLVFARFRAHAVIQAITPQDMYDILTSEGFKITIPEFSRIITDLVNIGVFNTNEIASKNPPLRFGKFPDMSDEGLMMLEKRFFPLLDFCIGLYQSLYNCREIHIPIKIIRNTPDKAFLRQLIYILEFAATQGFPSFEPLMKGLEQLATEGSLVNED